MAILYRNTDRDWQQIGINDPFWGVLTAPEFRKESMDPQALERFYASGIDHVDWVARQIEHLFGEPLRVKRALDFGSGVGRITHAMPMYADTVVGVDISPGMIEKARARGGERVKFSETPGAGRFDWIHSFIVFQHIPPPRGMAILNDLLSQLNPGGWATLHFTVDSPEHKPRTLWQKLFQWYRMRFEPSDRISMFDYDIGALITQFYTHGIEQMTLLPTDHGGHKGVFIIGRSKDN